MLDRLLEEKELVIEGISGTSAGAMNAVALAWGHFAGGREAARPLFLFWRAVNQPGGGNVFGDSRAVDRGVEPATGFTPTPLFLSIETLMLSAKAPSQLDPFST